MSEGSSGRPEPAKAPLGRLLNDPALYEDLDDAARRLDATLATLATLIEAIKAEGVKVEF